MDVSVNKLNKNETTSSPLSNKRDFAEEKRINSIREMKKTYQNQKNAIKAALSNVDTSSNNKIIFGSNESDNSYNIKKSGRKALFNDDDEDVEYNFDSKDYLAGKKGRKLMELQSRFKNDKRFTMDEKFIDDEEEIEESEKNGINYAFTGEENDAAITKEEKETEITILENILGEKIKRTDKNVENHLFTSYRYLPNSELSMHVLTEEEQEVEEEEQQKEEKKRKLGQQDILEENKEIKKACVSKETFSEVKENIFKGTNSFTFLTDDTPTENTTNEILDDKDNGFIQTEHKNYANRKENPFKYDSSEESDDEQPETVDENKDKIEDLENKPSTTSKLFSEPFFFREDDYRLQEGVDFVKKFELDDDNSEFKQIRRNIKEIVRAKVRHNQRRNKPFKRKLGGKRMLRIKKALKNK